MKHEASGWTGVMAACILALLAGGAAAQQDGQTSDRSTRSGVYTVAQANRGRDTYAGMCQACHSPATHTGPAFTDAWGGRTLWELFRYISEQMPKSDPGSLAASEYAQVLAYVLELNGMPPGNTQLPTDSVILGKIRFDTTTIHRRAR